MLKFFNSLICLYVYITKNIGVLNILKLYETQMREGHSYFEVYYFYILEACVYNQHKYGILSNKLELTFCIHHYLRVKCIFNTPNL